MLLPGPEAQQLAIYIGWLLHKTKGGLIAGTLFVLPGFVAIMALSWLYALLGHVAAVGALFFGLKAAVLAIVLEAVRRIGRRALGNNLMRAIAAAAFVGIFFLSMPFPAIVLAAGAIGYAGSRAGWRAFAGDRQRPRRRRPPPARRARRRSATTCPTMPGPICAGRCASPRSCCCSGLRRSPLCSPGWGQTMCSAGSGCSSRKWRW